MIDTFLKLIDKLTELVKERSAKNIIYRDDVLHPIFMELEKVHGDYINTFTFAAKSGKPGSILHNSLKIIETNRVNLLPVRQKLQAFVDASSGDEFFLAVGEYFGVGKSGLSGYTWAATLLNHLAINENWPIVGSIFNPLISVESEEQKQFISDLAHEDPVFESYYKLKFADKYCRLNDNERDVIAKAILAHQVAHLSSAWSKVCQEYYKMQISLIKS